MSIRTKLNCIVQEKSNMYYNCHVNKAEQNWTEKEKERWIEREKEKQRQWKRVVKTEGEEQIVVSDKHL